MTNFKTPKDGSLPQQTASKTAQVSPNSQKSESEHVQFIIEESMRTRPNYSSIKESLNLIISLDLLRDLQGINAKPQVIDSIEARINELSKVSKPLKRK